MRLGRKTPEIEQLREAAESTRARLAAELDRDAQRHQRELDSRAEQVIERTQRIADERIEREAERAERAQARLRD